MLDEKLLLELKIFVEKHINVPDFALCKSAKFMDQSVCEEIQVVDLEEYINNNRKPAFSQILFKLIDKKGVPDSEIYKKAGIDRRHFSKIRSNPEYKISKNTAIALALALELSKKDTDELLGAAGYYLSDNETLDLVIQFCIKKRIYDIHSVNQALDYFSLKPLAGVAE